MDFDFSGSSRRGRGRPPKCIPSSIISAEQFKDANGNMIQRDFLCQICGKTYLSNPALYLHMKVKHVQGEGRELGGEYKRGRGRPKKNPDQLVGATLLTSTYGRTDPTGEMFMRSEDKAGGPTDPIIGFEDCVNLLFGSKFISYTQHPLYEFLQRFSHKVTPMPTPDNEDDPNSICLRRNFLHVSKDLYQMAENKKNMLNCEQIFTLYLREFSPMVNEIYYRKIMTFILLFRECLNIYGWHKRAEHEVREYYDQYDYERRLKDKLDNFDQYRAASEYTSVNNCEYAPEIANEFVTVFYDENSSNHLSRPEIIDLTQHLSNWLFSQKYTCSKLSMVSN